MPDHPDIATTTHLRRDHPEPRHVEHGVGAAGEDGSLVSEYGLVAVLGATIAGLAIAWARGGAITTLLSAVLEQLRGVVVG